MAHGPHDHVHRLIRSMTRQEKRYFKLYTSRHVVGGQSNPQMLFDAIAVMDKYDEAGLAAQFAGEPFMRHFAITKHRLYETILASLDAFHAESSVDVRLHRQLHSVEILFQRGLYADAEKMLFSVQQAARKHDKQSILLDVADWQRRLMEQANYEGVKEQELDDLARTTNGLHREKEQTDALWELKSRSFMLLYRQGQVRSEENAQELRNMLDHPLLKTNVELLTARAHYLHHHIRAAITFALGDLQACDHHLAANTEVLRQHHDQFRDEPNLLLSVMSNHAYVRMRLGHYPKAMEGLKEFKRLPALLPQAPSPDLELKVFAMGASLELAVLCRIGEFERALEKWPMIEEGLRKYDDRLSLIRKAGIWLQAAWAHFGIGDLERATRCCHHLLNEPGIDKHEEVHAMGRMLDLLILLESGKKELLSYALRNTERFLQGRDRTFRFERALLRYVRARMSARTQQKMQQAHLALRDALLPLEHDPMERAVFDHFDPLAWAESKVSGKSLIDVLRARAIAVQFEASREPLEKRPAPKRAA